MQWFGRDFAIGQGVWNVAKRYPVETFQLSARRYGSEFHIFSIISSLALLGVPSKKPIQLIVPAPPSLVSRVPEGYDKTVAQTIKDNILGGEDGSGSGKWTIAINGDTPITYQISKVIVIHEGIGGYAAYRWNIQGELVYLWNPTRSYDYLSGDLRILDLGFGTADTFNIYNEALAAESIRHASNPSSGLYTWMIKPVLDEIKSIPGSDYIHAMHVDGWLREWVASSCDLSKLNVLIGSHNVDLSEVVLSLRERYANFIIEQKIMLVCHPDITFLETGGGWHFVEVLIHQRVQKTVFLSPSRFKHTRPFAFHDLNGYGLLVFAANNIRYWRGRSGDNDR